jgi:AcrR family transcriptional regulator
MSTEMTKRQRMPREQRQQRMLDAAEAVFSEHSFVAAPMDEIAQRSGITKALIYQYFGSKEGLYEAMIERGRTRLFDELTTALEGVEDGYPKLEAFVRGYFDYVDANRGTWLLLYGETGSAAVNEMRARNSAVVEELLRSAVAEGGEFSPEMTAVLARTLVGAGEEVGRWWAVNPGIDKQEVVRDFLAVAAGAIAGAVGASVHA